MKLQHVILCEGYDDRAFWAGLLLHAGMRDLSVRPGSTRRQRVEDPWGRPVTQGQFGYGTASGAFVRLHACDGGENVPPTAAQYFKGHPTHPVGTLLVNIDADDTIAAPSTRARDIVIGLVKSAGGPPQPDASGAYTAKDVTVRPVVWTCADPDVPGLPAQQTLERLVAAAIIAAYPARGPCVRDWLAAAPHGGGSHKNYAMSYYAKWYASERGPDDFYRELWNDPRVAAELIARLRASGAWTHLDALVRT